jgi:hypothetical protein
MRNQRMEAQTTNDMLFALMGGASGEHLQNPANVN